jgi:hypothetical protein
MMASAECVSQLRQVFCAHGFVFYRLGSIILKGVVERNAKEAAQKSKSPRKPLWRVFG